MHSDTLELKQKWSWIKQAHQRFQYTLQQRDELHEAIEILEQKLQAVNQIEQVDKFKQQLTVLKQKKRELDHLLDDSEELTPGDIAAAERELIDKILVAFPDQSEEWEFRQTLIMKTRQAEKDWGVLHEGCKHLDEVLMRVSALRKSVQGMGMLNYIFGMSPNAAISRSLQEGERAIKAIVPLIDVYYVKEQDPSRKIFYHQLIEFLQETEKHLCKSWGFRHLDMDVRAAEDLLKIYLEQIDAFKTAATKEIARLEQEEIDWIERLTK